MIYEKFNPTWLGGEVLHILQKEERLGYWRCRRQQANGRPCDWSDPCSQGWVEYKSSWMWGSQTGTSTVMEKKLHTDHGNLLPLLLTCRKM